jgi:hypothetical protein
MKCRSNNKCKTGFCNNYGRCDYPGLKVPKGGPGARGQPRRPRQGPGMGPRFMEPGPNKVRDEAMRINIPKETVRATGTPVPTQ